MKKRRTKRKIGPNGLGYIAAAAILLLSSMMLWAGEKPKKGMAPTALIAGTVFRGTGLSLPGARLSLEANPEGGAKSKFKKMSMTADSRGEFAIRVPAMPMRYRLTAGADGFETATRDISVQGEERVDLSIILDPKAK